MLRRIKLAIAPLLALGLLLMNLGAFTKSVSAHNWDSFHWDRGGYIVLYHGWQGGCCRAQANAAMSNGWNTINILYNYWAADYTHTNISVWSEYNTASWGGVATQECDDFDWGSFWWTHTCHAHARYNSRYGSTDTWWIQGVFCQEIFHTYGFDHSNDGGCMGLGYYAGSSNVYVQHNNNDFTARYWNH